MQLAPNKPTTGRPAITFTGVDERTNLAQAAKIPAEFGALYTADPKGRNRYPARVVVELAGLEIPYTALHVCGRHARHQLFTGQLDDLLPFFQRIQINGSFAPAEDDTLIGFCEAHPHHQIITQLSALNAHQINSIFPNHQILVDASGGRGVLPGMWKAPQTRRQFGFAGGLGPHNLAMQLEEILPLVQPGWWIDMESHVRATTDRSGDWLSLRKCQDCITQFSHATANIPR